MIQLRRNTTDGRDAMPDRVSAEDSVEEVILGMPSGEQVVDLIPDAKSCGTEIRGLIAPAWVEIVYDADGTASIFNRFLQKLGLLGDQGNNRN